MGPLEQLFALETEFFRELRCRAPTFFDAAEIHTSYALQAGYEALLRRLDELAPRRSTGLAGNRLGSSIQETCRQARDSIMNMLGPEAWSWPRR